MSLTMPLMKTGQVTLDSSGNGSVTLTPGQYNTTWHLTQASVRTIQDKITKEARAQFESFPYQLPGTFSGSSGDTTGLDLLLSASQQIKCTWTGGDPGAVATFTISGTTTIQGG